jgi:TonB family protein
MREEDFEQEPGFWQRNWLPVTLAFAVLAGGGFVAHKMMEGSGGAGPKVERFVSVSIPPPPPPPPPPSPKPLTPPPPQEQKMVEQTPVNEPEPKDKPEPPKAEEPIGSNIKGEGNDGFGLSGNGGIGLGSGLGCGGARTGSKYGWYAGQVQGRIQQALRDNRRTRSANMRVEVRIWPDSSGRISRAQIAHSSGDPALDALLQNEILTGLRLPEPPPAGMPLPIVMRLTASRP